MFAHCGQIEQNTEPWDYWLRESLIDGQTWIDWATYFENARNPVCTHLEEYLIHNYRDIEWYYFDEECMP